MKKYIFFFIILASQIIFAQEITVKDSITRNPIPNVAFYSTDGKISSLSNKKGVVKIKIFDNYSFFIQHTSYEQKFLKTSQIRKNIILLVPKNLLLNEVLLSDKNETFVCDSLSIQKIKKKDIIISQSSNSGDLLQKFGGLNTQKSQIGGGSPNLKGMEANRILLVVDGIKMNNLIYRSGHLHNIMTVDPFALKQVIISNRMSSIIYGSGALGGAILFNTLNPLKKGIKKFSFYQQIETASEATLANFHAQYGTKKISFLSGITFKSFGNSTMGENRTHGYLNWGNESSSTSGKKQLFTSYDQVDFIHKTKINLTEKSSISTNTQYSNSSNINRFDMLNGESNYSDWYYGPQERIMQIVNLKSKKKSLFFDNFAITFSYQNIVDSRHKSKIGSTLFTRRFENVNIYDFLLNFEKKYSLYT